MLDLLREKGGESIKVFGGGGGVSVPAEIRELMAYGVTRLYSPEDGAKLGLQGMIDDVIRTSDYDLSALAPAEGDAVEALRSGNRRQLARVITAVENRHYPMRVRQALLQAAAGLKTPVAGITGTGGAGKSPLTDELIAINKFDRKGSEDALRDVRKRYQRNHEWFAQAAETMPVYGTMASRFNDDGVTALYQAILPRLQEKGLKSGPGKLPHVAVKSSSRGRAIVPPERVRYLAEISESLREFHRFIRRQARIARERQSLRTSKTLFAASGLSLAGFDERIAAKSAELDPARAKLREQCPKTQA